MHPLLERQLARSLGAQQPAGLEAFLALVDATYNAADDDRRLVERSLELTSAELMQRNDALRAEIRKRSESDAARAAVIDRALDGIILIDGKGMVRDFNPAAQATFGYAREEAMNHELASLIVPPDQRDAHRLGFQRFQATGSGRFLGNRVEVVAMRKDGSIFDAELALAPFQVQDQVMVAGFVRDISARRKAQQALELAYERLKEVDESRRRFLNSAAHELGTPLTPIRMQLSLIERHAKAGDAEGALRSLEVVNRNVERLGRMVADLLDGARLQSGRLATKRERVDLRAVVDASIASFGPVVAATQTRLEVSGPSGLWVDADAGRLQQVLDNLVANAAKFSPPHGAIRITLSVHDEHARVEVRDEGIGIAPEDIPRLFQPFIQLHDQSMKDRALGGTGLGLFISRGIIEAFGGNITVSSQGRGKGATFQFELPLAPPPSSTEAAS